MPLEADIAVPPVLPTTAARAGRFRQAMLVLHRYVGLAIATFLVVAGVTGSVLVFYHELDEALNPHLYRAVPSATGAELLDPITLRERLMAQRPGHALDTLVLRSRPGTNVTIWLAEDGAAAREHFVDPHTGDLRGSRAWGDLSEGIVNLMPFIYRLHFQLALGEVGTLLFGIVALLWTVDCFAGLCLTFPPGRTPLSQDRRSWLGRWMPAWVVRAASLFGAMFTFHRASGLWLWGLLLVFAWSAVGFNLRPVFTPAMSAVLPTTDVWSDLPSLEHPRAEPHLGWQDALIHGRRLMADQAVQAGFTVRAEGSLSYEPSQGLYRYDVHSSLDLSDRWPGTRVWFHGDSGLPIAFDAPTGVASGNTVTSWLFALHMGTVGGLAYRLLLVVVGLSVAALSITGTIIWWRKRRRRRRLIPN